MPVLAGLHRGTAVAGDPSTNARFYWDVLGLRLVKRTVNFDDPLERLGMGLMLPAWLEPQRARIEAALPPLAIHGR